MSGPTLPPQAYTREILTAAFNWLQTQPESVRKLATTPDSLVGLYCRAKRFGNSSFEADAPVSSQNFMSDLKHLAEGLKQFDDPRDQRRQAAAIVNPGFSAPVTAPEPPPHSPTQTTHLNERSQAMIQEVKNQLNLSNDAETINMMLALAYKSLKNLLA